MKGKKRQILIALLAALLAGTAGCGTGEIPLVERNGASPAPLDVRPATVPESTPESKESETQEAAESAEPSVPETLEETVLDTWNLDMENGNVWKYDQNHGNAEIQAYPLTEDTALARGFVYAENADRNILSATWVGPAGMGSRGGFASDGNNFCVSDSSDKHVLYLWHAGLFADENDLMKNVSKEDIMTWMLGSAVEDTYQVVEDSDTLYSVLFEVSYEENGTSYRGYAYFIDYPDRMEGYQFEYLVEESLFNEEEAMAVIDSIAYMSPEEMEQYR